MKTEVFLDLDGVLVDLVGGVSKFYGVPQPFLNPANHGKYYLDKILGIKPEDFWSPLGYDFWSTLEWMPDATEILFRLFHYVDHKQSTLLTSPISTEGCVEGKCHWIRKHMPRWSRRFLIGSGKEAIAGPGKLLIDDYDQNVDKWIEAGGPAILVPRPWNRLHALPTLTYLSTELKRYFDEPVEKLVQKS